MTQNGSTARGQQNRHIIKKGNRLEADLSGTARPSRILILISAVTGGAWYLTMAHAAGVVGITRGHIQGRRFI